MKSILSTGLGRLHLLQTAEILHELGVDLELIQGWVPRRTPELLLQLLGRVAGARSLSSGMAKRRVPFLPREQVHSCAFADFYSQGLFLLNRIGLLSRGIAARAGWDCYGRSSSRFIQAGDIFHVRSGAGRGGALSRARHLGLKAIVDHSIAHPAFLDAALRTEYEKFGFAFWMSPEDPFWAAVLADCYEADALLVNSQFVKDTFVEQGFSEEKIHVIYLGVRDDFIRLKNDYPEKKTIELLFTGGFGLRKGAQYLIPALEQLAQEGLDWRLTVVGTTNEAEALLSNSIVSPRINLVGHVPQEDLKAHLELADIYVFPTLAEGCASSAMEAMAAGLPVITTKESGLPIRHGVDGWIIKSKSISELVSAIHEIALNRKLREQLGRAAADRIAVEYTWKAYAHRVLRLYSQIAKV